jgi:hypothetical protein
MTSAARFDGQTTVKCDALTCLNNPYFSAAFWFKLENNVDYPFPVVFAVDPREGEGAYGSNVSLGVDDNALFFSVDSFEQAEISNYQSSALSPLFGKWRCCVMAQDLSGVSRKGKIYIDGIDVTRDGVGDATPFDQEANGLPFWLGWDGFTTTRFTGSLYNYMGMPGFSLLNDDGIIPRSTLQLFRTSLGSPVDPAVAISALGHTPAVLLTGPASSFYRNQGNGGTFYVDGTLTTSEGPKRYRMPPNNQTNPNAAIPVWNVGSVPIPPGYQFIEYEQVTDLSSAVGIEAPDGATLAIVQVNNGVVRYRVDGTDPTGTVGMLLYATGPSKSFSEFDGLAFIQATGSTGSLNIEWYGPPS